MTVVISKQSRRLRRWSINRSAMNKLRMLEILELTDSLCWLCYALLSLICLTEVSPLSPYMLQPIITWLVFIWSWRSAMESELWTGLASVKQCKSSLQNIGKAGAAHDNIRAAKLVSQAANWWLIIHVLIGTSNTGIIHGLLGTEDISSMTSYDHMTYQSWSPRNISSLTTWQVLMVFQDHFQDLRVLF